MSIPTVASGDHRLYRLRGMGCFATLFQTIPRQEGTSGSDMTTVDHGAVAHKQERLGSVGVRALPQMLSPGPVQCRSSQPPWAYRLTTSQPARFLRFSCFETHHSIPLLVSRAPFLSFDSLHSFASQLSKLSPNLRFSAHPMHCMGLPSWIWLAWKWLGQVSRA